MLSKVALLRSPSTTSVYFRSTLTKSVLTRYPPAGLSSSTFESVHHHNMSTHVHLRNPLTNPRSHQNELLAGYQEYLDQLTSSTRQIEQTLQDLETTYAKKKELHRTTTTRDDNDNSSSLCLGVDCDELERLFDLAQEQKKEIRQHVRDIQDIIHHHKKHSVPLFAVDSPDGEVDAHLEEEVKEVAILMEEQNHNIPASQPSSK